MHIAQGLTSGRPSTALPPVPPGVGEKAALRAMPASRGVEARATFPCCFVTEESSWQASP